MGSRPAHSSRPRPAASRPKTHQRKPAVPSMPKASAARILLEVRQRLEVARAAAAITAAGLRSEVDCKEEAATTLNHCVCDVIDDQIDWLKWVGNHCLPLARPSIDRDHAKADIDVARETEENQP